MNIWRKKQGGGNLTVYRKLGNSFSYQVNVNPDWYEPVTAFFESYDTDGFFTSCLYVGDDLQTALEWCDQHDATEIEILKIYNNNGEG